MQIIVVAKRIPISLLVCLSMLVLPTALYSQRTIARDSKSECISPSTHVSMAMKANRLTVFDIKPWHLKASFKTFDESGNQTEDGVYEELWAGPNKDKYSLTGVTFARTDYLTENGLLRSGSRLPLPLGVDDLRHEFIHPFGDPAARNSELVNEENANTSDRQLTRFGLISWDCHAQHDLFYSERYSWGAYKVIGSNSVTFQGHLIAGDLRFFRGQKIILTAHLDTIQASDTVNDGDFLPSHDAVPPAIHVNVSAATATSMLLEAAPPSYPPTAKAVHVSGTVALIVLIGRDGHVNELRVLSGPPLLRQAALDAVRTRIYRPYVINGEAVEIMTTAYVTFYLEKPTNEGS
jgi:protein TonB